jgi:hypothetical protein
LLLLLGVQSWLLLGHGDYGHRHEFRWIAVALFAGLIPPIRRGLNRAWERIARPGDRTRLIVAGLIALLSAIFIYISEREQGIAIHPYFHDEFSYMLQMQMLARGRLWMPAHPCAQFLDTFYVITHPVYASMYFPGAALMFVPAVWLHLPYFVATLTAAGLCAGLLFLIVTEILDGAMALLAVLILLSEATFRLDAIMLLSQIPVLLLGLTMTWSWLRWRRSAMVNQDAIVTENQNIFSGWAQPAGLIRRLKIVNPYLALLGASAGWAAITRPADALCFAATIGSAIAMDLWRSSPRVWLKTLGIIFASAAPFLLLQLIFNLGVTGNLLQTPFEYYTDQNYPGARYGFRELPANAEPASTLPQKRLFYETRILPDLRQHRFPDAGKLFQDRLDFATSRLVPDPLLWLLFPLAVAALWERRRWAVWGVFPLFLIVYTGYAFFPLPTYLPTLIPAVVLVTILPIQFLCSAFPNQRAFIRTMLGMSILFLMIVAMPQFDRLAHDQYFNMYELETIDRQLPQKVSPPAVVLFHFNVNTMLDGKPFTSNADEEPVYNSTVAWPDDAPIIRAHDLNPIVDSIGKPGDLNLPLYAYYLRTDPRRVFYLYDRLGGSSKLSRLGTAGEMVQQTSPR